MRENKWKEEKRERKRKKEGQQQQHLARQIRAQRRADRKKKEDNKCQPSLSLDDASAAADRLAGLGCLLGLLGFERLEPPGSGRSPSVSAPVRGGMVLPWTLLHDASRGGTAALGAGECRVDSVAKDEAFHAQCGDVHAQVEHREIRVHLAVLLSDKHPICKWIGYEPHGNLATVFLAGGTQRLFYQLVRGAIGEDGDLDHRAVRKTSTVKQNKQHAMRRKQP